MLYSPSNEVERMLNQMIRQSQYQHQNNIKAIIRSKPKKEDDKKPIKKIKKMVPTDDNWKEFKMVEVRCKCPISLTTTTSKKKKGEITLRRFEDTGYHIKCPIHSP